MAENFSFTMTDCDKEKRRKRRRGPRLTGVSKQRRLANARERKRVQILNEKIDNLRDILPILPRERKPTKTEVIWLAASYIGELTEMLQNLSTPQVERTILHDEVFPFDLESLLSLDVEDLLNF